MAIVAYLIKFFNTFMLTVFAALMAMFAVGCSQKESPPYFTARVVDVYNTQTVLENFKILYWWEERGETPFLKPYTYRAKELVAEVMIPFKDNPRRVTVKTVRIPLQNIDYMTLSLSDYGKKIKVRMRNGKEIVVEDDFPDVLKKGDKTGLADSNIFIIGTVRQADQKREFKLELNMAKRIEIIKIDYN